MGPKDWSKKTAPKPWPLFIEDNLKLYSVQPQNHLYHAFSTLVELQKNSHMHTAGNWFDISFYLVISKQNIHLTRIPIDLEIVSYAPEA